MASLNIGTNLRPCLVRGKNNEKIKALFHTWATYSSVIEPSILKGGHPGGTISRTVAIVEYEDGSVSEEYPDDIRFLPIDFNEYVYPEVKDEENTDNV